MQKRSFIALLFFFVSFGNPINAQEKSNVFTIKNPDYKISPHTGMTREHWKDAGLYLLEGAFSYVNKLDDPMKFPKQAGKSYPKDGGDNNTEKLEGLCRTLFIAAPLLKENPNLKINNINVAEYYRYQIGKLIDPKSDTYITRRNFDYASQNLVEFGGLAVSLFVAKDVLWTPLTQSQKDILAVTMLSYADGPTVDSNWKFFNIFVFSFFKSEGYAIDEQVLEQFLDKTLKHYSGEGWYNDAPCYDYYSMWAFQMYGAIWTEYFGKKYYPEVAAKFASNFSDLKNNYPYMFSRDGEMIMWGRSVSYRFGAVAPLILTGLEKDPTTNYGWMRRIASGSLLQFLQNPDFLKDRVPTLGFYGEFEPAVEPYSCRGSAFWMAKAFLGLIVPQSNAFWTATENEGAWNKEIKKGTVYNKFQPASNILITDYANIGASEIRAWSNAKKGTGDSKSFYRSSERYNRLSYNSAFPWQTDGTNGEVAMDYVFKAKDNKWYPATLYTFKKYENDIYYRDVVFEEDEAVSLSLAEITMPNGILRVDKNTSKSNVQLRLGHYALPNLTGTIKKSTRKIGKYQAQIIDNGEYQLAMVPLMGWGNSLETITTNNLHPQSKESVIMNVSDTYELGGNPYYITLMLWKKSGEKWSDKDLVPIKKIEMKNNNVILEMNNGIKKTVLFN
jgi:hypothetical protein